MEARDETFTHEPNIGHFHVRRINDPTCGFTKTTKDPSFYKPFGFMHLFSHQPKPLQLGAFEWYLLWKLISIKAIAWEQMTMKWKLSPTHGNCSSHAWGTTILSFHVWKWFEISHVFIIFMEVFHPTPIRASCLLI